MPAVDGEQYYDTREGRKSSFWSWKRWGASARKNAAADGKPSQQQENMWGAAEKDGSIWGATDEQSVRAEDGEVLNVCA
jgi:hypothetical protein